MTSINAAVVTVSDTRTGDDDLSGDRLVELLKAAGAEIFERVIVKDEPEQLRETLVALADGGDVNLIITTGGTGFAPRDNTPEATLAVIRAVEAAGTM